jgi:hypothetical protein
MLLLYEMGEAKRIPERAALAMTDALGAHYLEIFPIRPGELPPGVDPARGTACHCALGNMYQVLAACGVAVDDSVPWIRPWFLRYQLADGGLNCDNDAYLQTEPASSMVGTIAALEAVLLFTGRPFTPEEASFLDRGARCLIERRLMRGSRSAHNAEERLDEEDWLKPCFPRFYFYDILRGLTFLLRWAETREQTLPADSISGALEHLSRTCQDGTVRVGRRAYEGVGTRAQSPSGEWVRRPAATTFPLLDRVSAVGEASPDLTRQWSEARSLVRRLTESGLIA